MNRYEKLEDKKIKYRINSDIILQGIITGCDPAIGVSVEEVGLPDGDHHYLICLNGPPSPEFLQSMQKPMRGFLIV